MALAVRRLASSSSISLSFLEKGSARTGPSYPIATSASRNSRIPITPVASGSSRWLSYWFSLSIPRGASLRSADTMSPPVSVRMSSPVSCEVHQCQESSTRPTLSEPISAISSLVSAIVWTKECREAVQLRLVPTYSSPRRKPCPPRISATLRRRPAVRLKFCR